MLAKLGYIVKSNIPVDNTSLVQKRCGLAAADGERLHILHQGRQQAMRSQTGSCYDAKHYHIAGKALRNALCQHWQAELHS